MTHDLAAMRKVAETAPEGPARELACSMYHHALQALYEAGELVPNPQSPVSIWVDRLKTMSVYDIASLLVSKDKLIDQQARQANRPRNVGMRALVQQAVDLIDGELTGIEWKRACQSFTKTAKAVLRNTNED